MSLELDLCSMDKIIAQFYAAEQQTPSLKHDVLECPQCQKIGLYNENGIITCNLCGSEFGGMIDEGAEWTNYGSNESRKGGDPNRCGASFNPLLPESSYGGVMSFSKYPSMNRLKQLNSWQAMPTHERTLKAVFDRLTYNGQSHGLTSNIIEFSHRLFVEAMVNQATLEDTTSSRGDPRDGIIAACLFYSCHEYGVARSSYEISIICELEEEDVNRGLNLFYDLMKNSSLIKISQYIIKYSDFIDRYCNKLELSEAMTQAVWALCDKVYQLKLLNNNIPQALVCACIFFIASTYRLPITKNDIYVKCGICIPTITKAYERLLPYTSQILN